MVMFDIVLSIGVVPFNRQFLYRESREEVVPLSQHLDDRHKLFSL
jgi:hypothetical protein